VTAHFFLEVNFNKIFHRTPFKRSGSLFFFSLFPIVFFFRFFCHFMGDRYSIESPSSIIFDPHLALPPVSYKLSPFSFSHLDGLICGLEYGKIVTPIGFSFPISAKSYRQKRHSFPRYSYFRLIALPFERSNISKALSITTTIAAAQKICPSVDSSPL